MKKDTRDTVEKEFKNFKELTRKLLRVSKEDLDKQRDAGQEYKDKSMKPLR